MRAATMKERPSFPLMRQTDVQSIYHMQMPRWLFSDPRYAGMSLDAKVAYTFLLNRFQLSRRNGWVNDFGEVFVIFPRKELARELRICEQKVTAAFRTLKELNLIWEKRCGRGDANQIYLATVVPQDDPDYTSAPFVDPDDGASRNADSEVLDGPDFPMPAQEPQDMGGKNRKDCASKTAESEVPEPRKRRPSYKDLSHTYPSHTDVSPSVPRTRADGRADGEAELMGILDACELQCFPSETARVFENAIERLFYADSFRVGNATLPQSRVRARLKLLDYTILQTAEAKLHANLDKPVKNSTAYTMATIFNCIAESESDLMVDPYLNGLRSSSQAPYPSPPADAEGSLTSPLLLSPCEPLRWVRMGAPEDGR